MTAIDGLRRGPGRPAPDRGPAGPAGGAPPPLGDAAASEGLVSDRDANTPESDGPPEPDWRRLLDGYAEPGRVRRLRDRQRQEAARRGRLRRGVWGVFKAPAGWI